MEPVQLAAILAGVVLLASMLSVELGIAVALFELGLAGILYASVSPTAAFLFPAAAMLFAASALLLGRTRR